MATLSQFKGAVTWTFRATGHTAQDSFHQRPVQAEEVHVHFAHRRTDGTGGLDWNVKVTGPALKKDGTPGQTRVEHDFSETWKENTPEWVTDLVTRLEPLAHRALSAPANEGF